MSQRKSGYERKERDLYHTPEWVTKCLLDHIPIHVGKVWEPAAGDGHMAEVLKERFDVWQSDIYPTQNLDAVADFLVSKLPESFSAIITNPPYDKALNFIELALRLTEPRNGFVAMLLRSDYDHAKTRRHLFEDCPSFSKKIILRKRIAWVVEDNGKPKSSPSFNHCWMIWDHQHKGPPILAYES